MPLPVSFRSWARTPGLAITLLSVIAIGVGATTATFSLVYSLVLRPLPYADPDALTILQTQSAALRGNARRVSLLDFEDYRRESRQFIGMVAFSPERFSLLEGGTARAVEYARVTSGFFETLGVRPMIGRTFAPEEDSARRPQRRRRHQPPALARALREPARRRRPAAPYFRHHAHRRGRDAPGL